MKNGFWDYEMFDYDDSGNRITYEKQVPGEEFEEVIKNITYYANTNHVKSDGEWGYVWDLDGNLVMKGKVFDDTETAIDISETEGEVWQYEWDAQNRLVRVKKSNAGTGNLQTITEYTYDHRGYRVKKAVYGDTGTETTYYTFGVGGEVLYKENTATLKYEEFVYVGGYYFAEITGTTDAAETVKYFYITDTLGSVTAMTDEDGRVVWTNEYLAFGNETGNVGFVDAPNIYAGHEFDANVQLYYARARWYDSEMGRFITEDPVKDGGNWYVYCYNNPLAWFDPDGKEPTPPPSGRGKLGGEFKPAYWEMRQNPKFTRDSALFIVASFVGGIANVPYSIFKKQFTDPIGYIDDMTKILRHPSEAVNDMLDNIHRLAQIYKHGDKATKAEVLGTIAGIAALSYAGGTAAGSATGGALSTIVTSANITGDALVLTTVAVSTTAVATTANVVTTLGVSSVALSSGMSDGGDTPIEFKDEISKFNLKGKSINSVRSKLKELGLEEKVTDTGRHEFVDEKGRVRAAYDPVKQKDGGHWHKFGYEKGQQYSLNNSGKVVESDTTAAHIPKK